MDELTLLMYIFDVHPDHRDVFQEVIKTTDPKYLELSLIQFGQHPDDPDYDASGTEWLEKYMPALARWAA